MINTIQPIMFNGWVRRKDIEQILLSIREIYESGNSEALPPQFYHGAIDSIDLALEKICGQKRAFDLLKKMQKTAPLK